MNLLPVAILGGAAWWLSRQPSRNPQLAFDFDAPKPKVIEFTKAQSDEVVRRNRAAAVLLEKVHQIALESTNVARNMSPIKGPSPRLRRLKELLMELDDLKREWAFLTKFFADVAPNGNIPSSAHENAKRAIQDFKSKFRQTTADLDQASVLMKEHYEILNDIVEYLKSPTGKAERAAALGPGKAADIEYKKRRDEEKRRAELSGLYQEAYGENS